MTGEPVSGPVPLERRVLRLWRIRLLATTIPLAVVAFVAVTVITTTPVALITTVVPGGVVGAASWWWTARVWQSWEFRIGEGALHLAHGVLIRRQSTIPFHRVQHIDTEAGPLERRLGLTTFVLRTASASSDSAVPGIDASQAEVLRARILALVGSGDAT